MGKKEVGMDMILQNSWQYAVAGLLPILLFLLATGHARLSPVDEGSGHAGCPDSRVTKDLLVFGGASAFTFGLPYFFLAGLFSSPYAGFLKTYGYLQLALSGLQVLTYLLQVPSSNLTSITLKSHLQGCGYTTAWSPFWLLYWLQKVPGFGWIVVVRDILTIAEYVASLPFTILLSILTKVLFGKWTVPVVTSVDHPH